MITSATFCLGTVECGIGLLQQFGHAVAMFRVEGNADAAAHSDFAAIGEFDGLFNQLGNIFGEFGGVVRVVEFFDEDGEFVAAQAADGIGATHALAETGGNLLQQGITNGVAKAVVDVFEVVQVKHQQCQPTPFALRPRQGMFEADVQ